VPVGAGFGKHVDPTRIALPHNQPRYADRCPEKKSADGVKAIRVHHRGSSYNSTKSDGSTGYGKSPPRRSRALRWSGGRPYLGL
jgi:hypothetical protein